MEKDILEVNSFKLTYQGGYGFENYEETFIVDPHGSEIITKGKNQDSNHIETRNILDKEQINNLIKYVNEEGVYSELRKNLEEGLLIQTIDGGFYQIEINFGYWSETYNLGLIHPEALIKLRHKLKELFEI